MNKCGFERKLRAIFSADVKGYSRLMRNDEEATVKTLNVYKTLMTELINQHGGRVIDSSGDNMLAEFESVVNSVKCSVNIQNELKLRNTKLPQEKQMEFRIGINLGDVLRNGERIYGDGVNVAARIESLADSGGVCVSRSAYDQVNKKLDLNFEYMGGHHVKNIDDPVRVYKVKMEADSVQEMEHSSTDRMAFPLPDEPSIAVLPFLNMSDDPKQEFFCDGLTEGVTATLSKSPGLFVIARNSTFTYKGKPVKVQQVSEDLGVRYVLEGSVQKSKDRVRITAQLIDALNGKHMWAERYDRDMKHIFTLQDEIAIHIMEAMQWKLTIGSRAREALGKGTQNLDAYLKLVEGQHYLVRANPEDYTKARKLFEETISLDPTYATPYIFLGILYALEVKNGWSGSSSQSLTKASTLAKKAEELDKFHTSLYILLGLLKLLSRQYEQAMASYERAFELDPNNSFSFYNKGNCMVFMEKPQEAIHVFEKMVRIDPLSPCWAYYGLGHANADMEAYEEAIFYHKKAIGINPTFLLTHVRIAGCFAASGRKDEAHTAAAEVLKQYPTFSSKKFTMALPYKDQHQNERLFIYLLDAGLPE